MDAREVTAYLDRIGYAGAREPTLEVLRALHRAHLFSVPFENLDIHAGRAIRLDRGAFFHKVVGERRGGFCYELNGLFGDLLASLGFDVTMLSARVAREAGGFGPEFDHMVLLVVVAGGRWLADVGFGRCFAEPVSLDQPLEQEAEGVRYRAVEREGQWFLESRSGERAWTAEYTFRFAPQPLEAFAGMCHHHQTSPESHFTQQIVCSMPKARGRVTVSGRSLLFTEGETRREEALADDAAVAAALAEHFGVRMPAR